MRNFPISGIQRFTLSVASDPDRTITFVVAAAACPAMSAVNAEESHRAGIIRRYKNSTQEKSPDELVYHQGFTSMPKAGFEPARLAAPPPQDGVSASSTTSARSRGLKPAAILLLLRCVGRRRRRSRSALLLLRLGRRLLSRLLLLLRLVLSSPFVNDGGAARLQIEDRQ